jgi:hypothetical protein
VFAQLLNAEQRADNRRVDLHADAHLANYVSHPLPGNRGNAPPAAASPASSTGGTRPVCQICGKTGHVASCCFKRFQANFLGVGNDGRNMDRQIFAFKHPKGGCGLHCHSCQDY